MHANHSEDNNFRLTFPRIGAGINLVFCTRGEGKLEHEQIEACNGRWSLLIKAKDAGRDLHPRIYYSRQKVESIRYRYSWPKHLSSAFVLLLCPPFVIHLLCHCNNDQQTWMLIFFNGSTIFPEYNHIISNWNRVLNSLPSGPLQPWRCQYKYLMALGTSQYGAMLHLFCTIMAFDCPPKDHFSEARTTFIQFMSRLEATYDRNRHIFQGKFYRACLHWWGNVQFRWSHSQSPAWCMTWSGLSKTWEGLAYSFSPHESDWLWRWASDPLVLTIRPAGLHPWCPEEPGNICHEKWHDRVMMLVRIWTQGQILEDCQAPYPSHESPHGTILAPS